MPRSALFFSNLGDAWSEADSFFAAQRGKLRELAQQQRGYKKVGIRHEDRGSTARELVTAFELGSMMEVFATLMLDFRLLPGMLS